MDPHDGPEWGYCTHDRCHEAAMPLWLAGDFPDDPDLFLCPRHIGLYIAELREACQFALRFHDRYCDRVSAADAWARVVHKKLRDAVGE